MQAVDRDVLGFVAHEHRVAVDERGPFAGDVLPDATVHLDDGVLVDRFAPEGPGGVSVLTKMSFTPTGDSLTRRMQSRV